MVFCVPRLSGSASKVVSRALYDLPCPRNIGYFWTFGRGLGVFYAVQLATGLSLRFYYSSSTEAFDTSLYIARDVNVGWLIRRAHANGASFFLLLAYLHIARGLYFSSFWRVGKVWLSGAVILLGVMAAAFLGYVLPWGQMSYWGATVITNLLGVLPVVGGPLVEMLWGGYTVGPATLTRFYSLHYIVPLAIAPVVLGHLELLHHGGSSNPLGVGGVTNSMLPFHPYSSRLDLVTLWVVVAGFAVIVLGYPHILGRPDNFELANPLKTPVHIIPEWYFLPFYTILRSVPQKTMGVAAMGLAIAVLFALPAWLRRVPLYLVWGFFLNVVALGWLGACPMEAPFPVLGGVNSVFYFFVYLVLATFRQQSPIKKTIAQKNFDN